jgi:protein-L-isoaspartate(D-aspartate) O-methyltransferase
MDAVSAAFAAYPRRGFLPRSERGRAAVDGPIPIGGGQTNSQPRTGATMLRLRDVRPGDRVLDVGAGSGWTTALLTHLAGPSGRVVGVERMPELAAWGSANLRAAGVAADLRVATPGILGLPEEGPWDRILVSAEAGEVPAPLLDQLADPGRMVLPVGPHLTLVVRGDGRDEVTTHGLYRFVPLIP